jgi:16S rRNA (guanine527-N7)-methyltransferase
MGKDLNVDLVDRWVSELDDLSTRIQPYRMVFDAQQRAKIARYCGELVEWNRRYALLSRHDVENVLRKHVAVCLGSALLVTPNEAEKWVDVGTGAGLPGVVLKIMSPDQPMTLIDGSHKKCIFLEHIRQVLGFRGVTILAKRVETLVIRGEGVGEFDVLFARAVADVRDTLGLFGPLVRSGGRIITFKGPGWEADVHAAVASGVLGKGEYSLEQVVRVPWCPGHILQIRKAAPAL